MKVFMIKKLMICGILLGVFNAQIYAGEKENQLVKLGQTSPSIIQDTSSNFGQSTDLIVKATAPKKSAGMAAGKLLWHQPYSRTSNPSAGCGDGDGDESSNKSGQILPITLKKQELNNRLQLNDRLLSIIDRNRNDFDEKNRFKQLSEDDEQEFEQLLDDGADVNSRSFYKSTALMLATGNGNLNIVQKLLEKNADVNAKDIFKKTVLMYAVENGNTDVVQKLLDRGADVNAQDMFDKTALMYAARNGNTDVVQKLLDRGADVNAKDEGDRTALMLANGNLNIVQKLLERGADVNAKDTSGQTALIQVAENGNKEIVQILLDRGADLHAKGYKGKTALMQAAENGNKEIVQILLDRGSNPNLVDLARVRNDAIKVMLTTAQSIYETQADYVLK